MQIDKLRIKKRHLTYSEIKVLNQEIKNFSNPVYFSKERWRRLGRVYIAKTGEELAGVSGVVKLNKWIKLGPFVVLEKYQRKGIGKAIMKKIADDFKDKNLYVGSRSSAVGKIAISLGFKRVENIWLLPWEIKIFIWNMIGEVFDWQYMKELIRKKSTQEGVFVCYIKHVVY